MTQQTQVIHIYKPVYRLHCVTNSAIPTDTACEQSSTVNVRDTQNRTFLQKMLHYKTSPTIAASWGIKPT